MFRKLFVLLVVFLTAALVTGCYADERQAAVQAKAVETAQTRVVYQPQNDIEFKNYDRREKLADDPTTILWCTTAWPFPGTPLITTPVVGKLTSGNKRPFPTQQAYVGYTQKYFPDLPGPDGMYGTSGEYRYGFTPASVYVDFYNMPTYCTTEPSVWQKQATTIVMQSDPVLLDAQNKAREALQKGDAAGAQKILQDAISKSQGGK